MRARVAVAATARTLPIVDASETPPILDVHALRKSYATPRGELTVLHEATFAVPRGGMAAIVGPSGSGKTTLLGLCAGLDAPTGGSVRIDGVALESLTEDQRARVRNEKVGFVFQNFQLIPTLTARENVMVPLELRGGARAEVRADELLAAVGLGERGDHYPVQLSGGEQQRVALARAFINEPAILFADEPTGNLDEETSHHITDLLFDLNAREGTTLVLVTHDLGLAARTGHIYRIRQGRLTAEDATPAAASVGHE